MVKHNNVVATSHFKKKWADRVKTWFDQPARAKRRRLARRKKAAKIFPRPTAGLLRPVVRGQTARYNMKLRSGKGFTFEELKVAGIPRKVAPTIGIAVDHRRRNHSEESLRLNVDRLKTYTSKLIVFPRRAKRFKPGDSAPEVLAVATQVKGDYMPVIQEKPLVEFVQVTEEMRSFNAFKKLRSEKRAARTVGAKLKKAAEAEKNIGKK